jgi:hypothetical protein
MDEANDPKSKESTASAAAAEAKDAALKVKAEAEKAFVEIKGRGVGGFFSFDHMYFPIVARYLFIVLCVLSVLGIVAGVLGGLVSIFTVGFFAGLSMMFGAVVFGIFGIIFMRLWFEMIMLGFSINENVRALRDSRG